MITILSSACTLCNRSFTLKSFNKSCHISETLLNFRFRLTMSGRLQTDPLQMHQRLSWLFHEEIQVQLCLCMSTSPVRPTHKRLLPACHNVSSAHACDESSPLKIQVLFGSLVHRWTCNNALHPGIPSKWNNGDKESEAVPLSNSKPKNKDKKVHRQAEGETALMGFRPQELLTQINTWNLSTMGLIRFHCVYREL